MATVKENYCTHNDKLLCASKNSCFLFGCYINKHREMIKGTAITKVPYPNEETIGE